MATRLLAKRLQGGANDLARLEASRRLAWVDDGVRTHDPQNHNLML
jgi:hypothetical protein